MRVLVLSPYPEKILAALDMSGDEAIVCTKQIDSSVCERESIDYLISYGYRHIIKRDVLAWLDGRSVNMHMSYLPSSRGAHPIFWSIVENRPLGVTIHRINEGLDTGRILYQKRLEVEEIHNETFDSLYRLHAEELESLFISKWKDLRLGKPKGILQVGEATFHRSSEIDFWQDCLPAGWMTTIGEFQSCVKKQGQC